MPLSGPMASASTHAARILPGLSGQIRPASPARRAFTNRDIPTEDFVVGSEEPCEPLRVPPPVSAAPIPWPEELGTPLIRVCSEIPEDLGSDESIVRARWAQPIPQVVLHGGVRVDRQTVRSPGFDGVNNPGGLPLTSENVYISPEFRQKLIDRINYVNRAYHLLFGTPYYSSQSGQASVAPAMTETGERLGRALLALREQTGAHSEQHLQTLFLYCVLEQEDPQMFAGWARDNGVQDAWEVLTSSWSGRASSSKLLHPLLNGMMVIPQRGAGHNYPSAALNSGVIESNIRPTFIISGGYRAILNVGEPLLKQYRLAGGVRYKGVYHSPAAHIHSSGSLEGLAHGGGLSGDTAVSLATPEMVSHFWNQFGPFVSYGNGNEIFDQLWSVFEILGLETDYQNQSPYPLWVAARSSSRTAWTALRIPTPTP